MAVTTGVVSAPYVQGITPLLVQREIYNKIIDIQQDDEWLTFLADSDKRTLYTPERSQANVSVFYSFYDNPLYLLIDTTGATVAGSGTTTITVTNLPSNSQNYLIVSDLIYTPAGAVARVQTATATGFTAQSVDGTNLVVTPGMKLSVFSNAQEEGSTTPSPRRWDVGTLSNGIQIFSNSLNMTDVEMMQGAEVDVDGRPSIVPYEMIRSWTKHRGDISLAFWMGRLGTTLFSDSSPTLSGVNGYGVQTTRGMDNYITNYGVNDSVTTPGTYTLADLNDLEAQLTAARAPKEYMVVGAQPVISTISDFLKNLGSSGAQSVRMVVNGREIDYMVDKFTHGGFTYNLRSLNVLSNTQVINYIGTGVSKIDIARSAYYLPMGKIPSVGNGMADYWRIRYMAPMAGPATPAFSTNGETAEYMTGLLAPVPSGTTRTLNVAWTSNMGLEVLAPQKFAKSIILA